jgi:hypothetical protein
MPRCSHCGKVNREGSLFCQDCGHRLEAAPAQPKPQAAGGPVCSACGTQNPPGMNFCKMCGTSLASKPVIAATMLADPSMAPQVQSQPAQPQQSKITCPACGKQTPGGFAFCQHCGQRLGAAQPQAQARPPSQQVNVAATIAAPSPLMNPTPPAGMPRPQIGSSGGPITSGRGVSSAEAMAKTMAPSPEELEQVRAQIAAATGQRPAARAPDTIMDDSPPTHQATMMAEPQPRPKPQPRPAASNEPRFGSLVTVNRDGTDGQKVELTGEAFDIGRTDGRLNFDADPYLAGRHCRILPQSGKVILRPLDPVNGVYVRLAGGSGCDLAPGDQFLVGKEVIRYEPTAPEERDPPNLVEHGVRLFGSSPRESWGRLRQVTTAGTTRDIWHLSRAELVLGREEGDVTFPDDEFMSRRHAAVRRGQAQGKARLEDLSSSNGTFLRVRGDRELKPGDVLRMGDQLMRFEP